MASSYQRLLSWLGSGDSLQPEAPPERRRVASQAPALSPQQPPRQRAGCERIAVVLVHAVPCDVRGAITGGLAWIAHVIAVPNRRTVRWRPFGSTNTAAYFFERPGVGTTRSSLSGMAHYLVLTTESVTMTKAPTSPSKAKPSAS